MGCLTWPFATLGSHNRLGTAAVTITNFWDEQLHVVTASYNLFRGTCYLQLQGRSTLEIEAPHIWERLQKNYTAQSPERRQLHIAVRTLEARSQEEASHLRFSCHWSYCGPLSYYNSVWYLAPCAKSADPDGRAVYGLVMRQQDCLDR